MPSRSDFNRFAVNPVSMDIGRSMLNLDHTVKFSANVGDCIPIEVREVLPGDTWQCTTTKVVRMQPMVAPIMDEIIFDTYWFFVPNRLVWNHWVNFMGENTESAWSPQTEYTIPKLNLSNGVNVGSIADYLGIPPKSTGDADLKVNALPFRGYALIMDQWFKSESLQNPVHVHVDDTERSISTGSDQVSDIELGGSPFIAGKYPDYFTSCLPSPQRGDPVTFELAGKAPVTSYSDNVFDINASLTDGVSAIKFGYDNSGKLGTFQGATSIGLKTNSFGQASANSTTTTVGGNGLIPYNLWADLGNISTFNVNDLRIAFAMQKYLEKSARYGGRYIEFLKGFFNVTSPDARLQRSEYLGGSRLPLNVNSIQQTSATVDGSTPQGNPSGLSVTAQQHEDFIYSATEHGFLFCIGVCRYNHSYSQGVERFWLQDTKWDFYNPVFASIGEQPVWKRQLWNDSSVEDQVFGYQEAWADYRFAPNRVSAEMRPGVDNSLAMWHLGDYYTEAPTLSSSWIREDKSPVDRTLAVTSSVSNQYFADIYFDMKAARPMPLYSIPGLIDHH